jgi:hypothetical protein
MDKHVKHRGPEIVICNTILNIFGNKACYVGILTLIMPISERVIFESCSLSQVHSENSTGKPSICAKFIYKVRPPSYVCWFITTFNYSTYHVISPEAIEFTKLYTNLAIRNKLYIPSGYLT